MSEVSFPVSLWRYFSWGQPLVHPASLCNMLKLPQLRISFLHLGEDDAVMKSVGLTLPELNRMRLDNVAAPVNKKTLILRKTLIYHSYLSGAFTSYSSNHSNLTPSSVTQGSVLGPLLFITFITPLAIFSINSTKNFVLSHYNPIDISFFSLIQM